eukprot:scaffold3310_cov283-Chaetoceros_neogracile.AAC.1
MVAILFDDASSPIRKQGWFGSVLSSGVLRQVLQHGTQRMVNGSLLTQVKSIVPLSVTLLGIPLRYNGELSSSLLTVMKSDVETEGMNIDFGVNKFDDKMIVVYQIKFKGLFNLTRLMIKEMSGKMGRDYKDGKTFDDGLTVKMATGTIASTRIEHHHCRLKATFEVVTDALPYFVFHEKDLPSQ